MRKYILVIHGGDSNMMKKGKCDCSPASMIAWILVIIGALNWGLVGIFRFDLIAYIFGGVQENAVAGLVSVPVISHIIYILVGISGLWLIYEYAMMKKMMK